MNKIKPFALLAFFATNSSHAIVNIEDLRSNDKTEGYSSTVDISTNGASGNSKFNVINAGIRAQYINTPVTYLIVANYAYGKSQGSVNVDKSFLHGR